MVYSIRHITHFAYEPAVRESVMEVRTQPRSEWHQRCLSFYLDVEPQASVFVYLDYLGNAVHHFDIPARENDVRITAKALVEVLNVPWPAPGDSGTWQDLDARVAQGDFWEMLLPSKFARSSELLLDLALELELNRGPEPFETILKLNQRLYEEFDYVPNSTKVDSPIEDALRNRQGVCQDLAHIMTALVRKLSVPCRYVSGYLFHDSHKPDRSSQGATHAWVEVYLGPLGWVGFDPTNNLVCNERHIRVAVGRDYADVPPTRGVYKGEAESALSVAVSVTEVNEPQTEEFLPPTVIRSRPVVPERSVRAQHDHEEQQQQQQQ
jgi:transglutaminase-like putative cysteine protease